MFLFEISFIQRKITLGVIFYTFMINRWYFRRKICPLVTRIFQGKLYIKIQSKTTEKYAYTRIYSIFTVCLCHKKHQNGQWINWYFFFNLAVTLTSKFQGQIINCLCLKNAWPNLHETKAVWINWLIYFIYDFGHWPCLWPWPWISKVKSWNWHIYETSDLIAKKK